MLGRYKGMKKIDAVQSYGCRQSIVDFADALAHKLKACMVPTTTGEAYYCTLSFTHAQSVDTKSGCSADCVHNEICVMCTVRAACADRVR